MFDHFGKDTTEWKAQAKRWGDLIRSVRKRLRLSQTQMAEEMGVEQPSISEYERYISIPSKAFRKFFLFKFVDKGAEKIIDKPQRIVIRRSDSDQASGAARELYEIIRLLPTDELDEILTLAKRLKEHADTKRKLTVLEAGHGRGRKENNGNGENHQDT